MDITHYTLGGTEKLPYTDTIHQGVSYITFEGSNRLKKNIKVTVLKNSNNYCLYTNCYWTCGPFFALQKKTLSSLQERK